MINLLSKNLNELNKRQIKIIELNIKDFNDPNFKIDYHPKNGIGCPSTATPKQRELIEYLIKISESINSDWLLIENLKSHIERGCSFYELNSPKSVESENFEALENFIDVYYSLNPKGVFDSQELVYYSKFKDEAFNKVLNIYHNLRDESRKV